METVDLLIKNASELVTVRGGSDKPFTGKKMGEPEIIKDGAVVIKNGKIEKVGTTREVMDSLLRKGDGISIKRTIDARGKTVTPGLIDPHTHAVFAGTRENEFEMRIAGKTYLEILAAGGGIHSTVRATRAATREELLRETMWRVNDMFAHGTTTAEVKSGYGLDLDTEIKMLEVVEELRFTHPIRLVPTYMGAHAMPAEYRENREGYIRLMLEQVMPQVVERKLALFCDVFCEPGAYTPEETERILEAAMAMGLKGKIHADEIHDSGGATLAAKLGVTSAEHLAAASDDGLAAMAEKGVVAVLLPATTFYLMHKTHARARRMIEMGLPVAIGTDCNPGSSMTSNMQLVMTLACLNLKMTPAEALVAATINAAHAIGLADETGSIEEGKCADIVIFDCPTHRHIPYSFGANRVDAVIKSGEVHVIPRFTVW